MGANGAEGGGWSVEGGNLICQRVQHSLSPDTSITITLNP